MTNQIKQVIFAATKQLSECSEPVLEAEMLLSHVIGKSRLEIRTWPEKELSEKESQRFSQLVQRRANGEPIAYILGKREFWSLPLSVSTDTLIPRHETEILVETVLNLLPNHLDTPVLELGTGSGAISLALASERKQWEILASDFSVQALNVAIENAKELNQLNVHFLLSDWFANIPARKFAAIISNPPYIPEGDPHLQIGDCRFEPKSALVSGVDGLDAIRMMVHTSPEYLEKGGWLVFEHGFDQHEAIMDLLMQAGFENIQDVKDYSGHYRVGIGQWLKN